MKKQPTGNVKKYLQLCIATDQKWFFENLSLEWWKELKTWRNNQQATAWIIYNYHMHAIIARSWFGTALDYKLRIFQLRKVFCNTIALQYKPQELLFRVKLGLFARTCNPSKWEADIWGWLEVRRSAMIHFNDRQRPHWACRQYGHTGGTRG